MEKKVICPGVAVMGNDNSDCSDCSHGKPHVHGSMCNYPRCAALQGYCARHDMGMPAMVCVPEEVVDAGDEIFTSSVCLPPITNVRTFVQGFHVHVFIFVNHAQAGELVLRQDELNDFLALLVKPCALPGVKPPATRSVRRIIARRNSD